jgi:hypothetical protein
MEVTRRSLARSPPLLLFSASFVRSFQVRIEIWEEFAPTQQHAKRAKGKTPDFTAIVTPISIICGENFYISPVLPCMHTAVTRYCYSYSSTTTRNCAPPSSFSHSGSVWYC